jgi:uncharacterized FlaG/YvyC family protein
MELHADIVTTTMKKSLTPPSSTIKQVNLAVVYQSTYHQHDANERTKGDNTNGQHSKDDVLFADKKQSTSAAIAKTIKSAKTPVGYVIHRRVRCVSCRM